MTSRGGPGGPEESGSVKRLLLLGFVVFLCGYGYAMHFFYSSRLPQSSVAPARAQVVGDEASGNVVLGPTDPALRQRQRELDQFFQPKHNLMLAEERAWFPHPEIINKRCPAECNGNGLCGKDGACSCEAGYTGEACERYDGTSKPDAQLFPMDGPEFVDHFSCHGEQQRDTILDYMSVWRNGGFGPDLITESVMVHPQCIVISIIDNVPYLTRRNKKTRMPDDKDQWLKWRDLILGLVQRVKIPDVEFPLCLANKPVVEKHDVWPVMGFQASPVHNDIPIPSGVHRADFVGGGAPYRLYHLVSDASWDRKASRAFWRGRASGVQSRIGKPYGYRTNSTSAFQHQLRARLCQLSQENPQFLDARFTMRDPEHPEMDALVESLIGDDLPLADQVRGFKYHIVADGQGPSMRFRAFLDANTVVIKIHSPVKEYFEPWLQPYTHYIPTHRHLNDLLDTIDWLRNHGSLAKRIAEHGMRTSRNLLRLEEIYSYYYLLLAHYAELETFQPAIDPADLASGRARRLDDPSAAEWR